MRTAFYNFSPTQTYIIQQDNDGNMLRLQLTNHGKLILMIITHFIYHELHFALFHQSHQVGLVWSGGNGWDDMMRDQVN